MKSLFNELVEGTREHLDNGGVILRAPTNLALRAAKTLEVYAGVNDTNNALIQQLQLREAEFVKETVALRLEIAQLLMHQKTLYSELLTKDSNERIRDGQREAGSMDPGTDSQSDLFGSDSGSEINNTSQNSSTGGN